MVVLVWGSVGCVDTPLWGCFREWCFRSVDG